MSEFNLHLSPLTFTLAFPFIIGDILTAKFNKIHATESELDYEHRLRQGGMMSMRRGGGKSLLKSGAKREILLVKSILLSGQKTIRKWTNLVLAPPSHEVNTRVHQNPSVLSAVAYGSQFLSSHQSTLMAVLFQEMISSSLGTACSS